MYQHIPSFPTRRSSDLQERHRVTGFFGQYERVHEAARARESSVELVVVVGAHGVDGGAVVGDRKSTRLNSSHRCISYAVFCLKKNNTHECTRLTYMYRV